MNTFTVRTGFYVWLKRSYYPDRWTGIVWPSEPNTPEWAMVERAVQKNIRPAPSRGLLEDINTWFQIAVLDANAPHRPQWDQFEQLYHETFRRVRENHTPPPIKARHEDGDDVVFRNGRPYASGLGSDSRSCALRETRLGGVLAPRRSCHGAEKASPIEEDIP